MRIELSPSGGDDTGRIQAAIDALDPVNGGTIQFSVGVYRIENPPLRLVDKHNVRLIGVLGRGDWVGQSLGSCLLNLATDGRNLLEVSKTSPGNIGLSVDGLTLKGTGQDGHGICIRGCGFIRLDSVNSFRHGGCGLWVENCTELYVCGCALTNNDGWGAMHESGYCNLMTLVSCNLSQNGLGGLRGAQQGLTLMGCTLEGQPIGLDWANLTVQVGRGLVIINCLFESMGRQIAQVGGSVNAFSVQIIGGSVHQLTSCLGWDIVGKQIWVSGFQFDISAGAIAPYFRLHNSQGVFCGYGVSDIDASDNSQVTML